MTASDVPPPSAVTSGVGEALASAAQYVAELKFRVLEIDPSEDLEDLEIDEDEAIAEEYQKK